MLHYALGSMCLREFWVNNLDLYKGKFALHVLYMYIHVIKCTLIC